MGNALEFFHVLCKGRDEFLDCIVTGDVTLIFYHTPWIKHSLTPVAPQSALSRSMLLTSYTYLFPGYTWILYVFFVKLLSQPSVSCCLVIWGSEKWIYFWRMLRNIYNVKTLSFLAFVCFASTQEDVKCSSWSNNSKNKMFVFQRCIEKILQLWDINRLKLLLVHSHKNPNCTY